MLNLNECGSKLSLCLAFMMHGGLMTLIRSFDEYSKQKD